jgi:hypothetical protein
MPQNVAQVPAFLDAQRLAGFDHLGDLIHGLNPPHREMCVDVNKNAIVF